MRAPEKQRDCGRQQDGADVDRSRAAINPVLQLGRYQRCTLLVCGNEPGSIEPSRLDDPNSQWLALGALQALAEPCGLTASDLRFIAASRHERRVGLSSPGLDPFRRHFEARCAIDTERGRRNEPVDGEQDREQWHEKTNGGAKQNRRPNRSVRPEVRT